MSPTSYQLLYSAIYSVPQCVIILYTLFQKLQAFLHKKFGFAEKISRRVLGGRFVLLLFALFCLFLLWSFLLFEDNELAEEVVENNHDDCEDYFCSHFAAEVEVYQRNVENLAVEVQEVYEDNESELLDAEGEESCRDERRNLFCEHLALPALALEDKQLVRDIGECDREYPCENVRDVNAELRGYELVEHHREQLERDEVDERCQHAEDDIEYRLFVDYLFEYCL